MEYRVYIEYTNIKHIDVLAKNEKEARSIVNNILDGHDREREAEIKQTYLENVEITEVQELT